MGSRKDEIPIRREREGSLRKLFLRLENRKSRFYEKEERS